MGSEKPFWEKPLILIIIIIIITSTLHQPYIDPTSHPHVAVNKYIYIYI